jgi:putative membrane-bound dehydrogenase-like protein
MRRRRGERSFVSVLCCIVLVTWTLRSELLAQNPTAAKLDPNADFSAELPRIKPKSPDEALKSFRLQPGYRIEQVAAEPLVTDPVAVSFDERGRMYVVGFRGYSENQAEILGEVRLLEDTDGDGRYDKSTQFVDKFAWPTAIVCYGGGVYIGDAPDIWYCKDADGDGRADIRCKIFTGFGTSNVQGLFNSFQWGLDNKIHGAGSSTGGNVQVVGDKVSKQPAVNLSGRDFAFDPRTHQLEATSGGAQHGMSFDAWGRKFVCSNSSHIELVMFEDRYVRRNKYLAAPGPRVMIAADGGQAEVFRISPVEPWRIVRTRLRVAGQVPGPIEGGGRAAGYFTSATGITIFKGDPLNGLYGQAFIGDVGSNIVHRKKLEADGVGLRAVRIDDKKEFLASDDIWFRPVQFANAPDGTLYVLDMYREVIEHPLSLPPIIKKHLDLTSGRDRGRIYRIVPDGFIQPALPRLDEATTAELVEAVGHPIAWQRETASRLLYERQDRAAIPLLEKLAVKGSALPLGRMHALRVLVGLQALTPDLLLKALQDPHPRVREHAVQLAERLAGESPALRTALLAMTGDEDLRVRYQLAFSLGEFTAEGRNRALAEIAKRDGGDAWVRLAVLSSLAEGSGEVFGQLAADAAYRSKPAGQTMLGALAQQVGLAKRTDEIANVLKAVATLPAEEKSLAASVVRELSQGLNKSGSELRTLLSSAGASTGKILDDLLVTARKSAADEKQSPPARAEAIRTLGLGTFEAERGLLTKLLDLRQPREVQLAALGALSRFTDAGVAPIVLEAWPGMSPGVRTAAIEALFARPERLMALLDAVEKNKFQPVDLEPARVEFLRKHSDAQVRARAAKLLAEVKLRRRQEVIDAYVPALKRTGDLARGKLAFQKTCAKCHRVEGVGFELAPSLAAMKNRGPETILVNVLDPNREVNPQFVNYLLLTEDGRSMTGIISAETATSVTLRRGEDQSDTVLRVNIAALQSTGLSIMPEGLEKEVDQQTMADLIAYLMTVK